MEYPLPCAIAGFLAILSAIMAFLAEANRIKASDATITDDGDCEYPSNSATTFGIVAIVSLLIAHITMSGVNGRSQRGTDQVNSGKRRTTGVVLYIFSWVAFFISFPLLVHATKTNSQIPGLVQNKTHCYYVSPGFFSNGGVFALVTIILGILSHSAFSSSSTTTVPATIGVVEVVGN